MLTRFSTTNRIAAKVMRFLSLTAALGIIARALVLPVNGAEALVRAANQILEHQVADGAIVMGRNPNLLKHLCRILARETF